MCICHVFDDWVQSQHKYICSTGGQDTPCSADGGEVVHQLDTCSNGIVYKDIGLLKQRLSSTGKWKDLSTLYNQVFANPSDPTSAHTGSDSSVNCSIDATGANCEVRSCTHGH